MIRFFSFIFLSVISSSFAAAFRPVRNLAELREPVRTETVRVKTARVVLADYDLIVQDFPQLQGKSHAEIDEWLRFYAGRIAKTQADQARVNTPIQSEVFPDDEFPAYRPKFYGRGLVFTVPGGFIDAKGAGAEKPSQGDHSNGLSTLGEDVREDLYQKALSIIFEHAHADVQVVRSYAEIDYGFDVLFPDGSSAAGLNLRQAHTRFEQHVESRLPFDRALEIENVMRAYGFTSTGLRFDFPTHELNIQGTADERAIFDFGSFLVLKEFTHPIRGGGNYLRTSDPRYGRGVSSLQVPVSIWGSPGTVDPTKDYPWTWSHELAANYRAGLATRADFEQHVRNMMAPIHHIVSTQAPVTVSPKLQCGTYLRPDPSL